MAQTLKPEGLFGADNLDALAPDGVEYVFVTKDRERYKDNPYDLFDGNTYDEMYGVTYVSSPKAFAKVAQRFERVEFILGTPDSEFETGLDSLVNLVNPETAINFWNGLTLPLKEKVAQHKVNIRYPQAKVTIHSKIYLLKNSTTLATRLILGSANLTETAFTRRPQFEDLMVYDNAGDLFEIYMQRFWQIHRSTVDYIPEVCKRQEDRELVVVADEKTVLNTINEVLTKNPTITIAFSEISALEEVMRRDLPRKVEEIERTINIVTKVAPTAKGGTAVISPAIIAQNYPKLKMLVAKRTPATDTVDARSRFIYDDTEKTLFVQRPGTDSKSTYAYSLAKEASVDEIRSSLECIHAFVDAYNLFTFQADPKNQARVMETILYAFMAPYLWKARDDIADDQGLAGMRAHIPPFLIIGGKARSGKTTLLDFMHRLLGEASGPGYFSYQTVEKTLPHMVSSENLYPVLIDEIPASFFKSTRDYKGDQFIKFMANERVGKHPVIIATTNHEAFSIGDQALRRIYYLSIDNTFNKERFVESSVHLSQVLAQVDGRLFSDFVFRMQAFLETRASLANPSDPLRKARDIFADYYAVTGLEVPRWFPSSRFNDYEDRGRNLWLEIYRSANSCFRRTDDNRVSVDYKDKALNWDDKQKDSVVNYLPPQIVVENKAVLLLREREFFQWIHAKRRRGFSIGSIIRFLGNR